MAVLYYQSPYKVLCAANETTEGTSALGTVADDGIPTRDLTVAIDTKHADIRLDSPYPFESPGPVLSVSVTVSFKVPIYGKGKTLTIVNVPRWASKLMGAFCDITQGTTLVMTLNPINPKFVSSTPTTTYKDQTSVTLGVYLGLNPDPAANTAPQVSGNKRLLIITGARPKSVKFPLKTKAESYIEFEYMGVLSSVADVTTDLSAYTADGLATDFVTPNQLGSTIATQPCLLTAAEIAIDFGTTERETDAAAYGVAGTDFMSPTITVGFDPLMVKQATYDQFQASLSSTGAAFETAEIYPAGRSSATGYGIKWAMPAVQYGASPDTGGALIRWKNAGRARKATDSGAPLTITIL